MKEKLSLLVLVGQIQIWYRSVYYRIWVLRERVMKLLYFLQFLRMIVVHDTFCIFTFWIMTYCPHTIQNMFNLVALCLEASYWFTLFRSVSTLMYHPRGPLGGVTLTPTWLDVVWQNLMCSCLLLFVTLEKCLCACSQVLYVRMYLYTGVNATNCDSGRSRAGVRWQVFVSRGTIGDTRRWRVEAARWRGRGGGVEGEEDGVAQGIGGRLAGNEAKKELVRKWESAEGVEAACLQGKSRKTCGKWRRGEEILGIKKMPEGEEEGKHYWGCGRWWKEKKTVEIKL